MTDKFTIRDILVYTFVGLSATIIFYTHNANVLNSLFKELIAFSDLAIILLVPLLYLLGHIVAGVDDILFNLLLYLPIRKKDIKKSNIFWKIYFFIFFGSRNQWLKYSNDIDEETFLKACDELIKENTYWKAEYYQVMSDLFKGIFLCLIASAIYRLVNCEFKFWEFVLIIIVWYRAKVFSSYYVRFVKRWTTI